MFEGLNPSKKFDRLLACIFGVYINVQGVFVNADIEIIGATTHLAVLNVRLLPPGTQVNKGCIRFATEGTEKFGSILHGDQLVTCVSPIFDHAGSGDVSMTFLIGCALWGYKEWVGDLFPSGSRAADFLRLYGERFTTVEGNTTFYSTPDEKTVARWAAETPSGFQFCPKLPKALTHSGQLSPAIADTRQFVNRMQGLGDRLGPIFAQLPPSYPPTQFEDLEAFLTALPRSEAEFALEVRHLDWFRSPYLEQLTELLTRLGVGRVLLDSRPVYQVSDDPQLQSERKKPNVPVDFSLTASFSLIRYISHPDWEMNLPFLQEWLGQVDRWLRQGKRVYWYVHCPVEARSPQTARCIQSLLEQHGSPVPPLPWNSFDPSSTQLNLF